MEVVENKILRPRPIRRARVSRGVPLFPQETLIDPEIVRKKAEFAEYTGKGNFLCIEGEFGRMFRSDPEAVKEELQHYNEMYKDICRKLDEDPAHEYHEVLSWNELYSLLGLVPSIAGDEFGYTNSDDYRLESIDFKYDIVKDNKWAQRFGEPYFYFCPEEYCFPDPCYMEA